MIKIRFEAAQEHQSITVGPAEGFRVSSNFLRQLPTNEVLGHYARHQWHVRDGHFSRYDCDEPCVVHFTDSEGTPSQVFGSFERLHVADGTMYTANTLFAKFIDDCFGTPSNSRPTGRT